MGRNSKKNKGRKPVAEQGLKGATSLSSASTDVSTAPSRPARTAKHKVRKFPPQAAATSSTPANDSPKAETSQSLKELQPVPTSLPPDNLSKKVENQEAVPSHTSATHHCESPPTTTAILKESPEAGSSSTEREVALQTPISSDSYDTSSSSSSETEMGFKNDLDNIPETHNVADILKIEQKGATEQTQRLNIWQQKDEKPEGLEAEKFVSISMVAMENKEVPQRAAGIGHSPQTVAVPGVKGPFTALSTCLHDKLEVSKLLHEQDVEAQANDRSTSSEPQQVSLKQKSLLKTETSCEDRSSDPAIARKEQDFMDAEPVASEQSSSWSETTVANASVTFCTSSDNLKQKLDQEEELELVDGSFDKGLEEDKDKTPAEEAPPCSIQNSASTDAHQQVEANARELVIDILLHQEREMSKQSNLDVVQALEAADLTPSLQSEEGQATTVVEQHTHVEVGQKHEPEELNRAERGTIEDEMQITDQELQPLKEKEHIITGVQDTVLVSPEKSINEAQQNLQERKLTASLNEDGEAQETKEKNSSAAQILECQEVAAQSVVLDEATTFGKHNLLDSEQNIKELGEPEACSHPINTRIEWQGKPDEAYTGSVYGVHITRSVGNEVKKLEVSETEAEDLTPEKNREYQDEQPHQLDGSIIFEGHATHSVETEAEKLEVVELEVHSIVLDKEECQEEEADEVHSGSVPEEHKTRGSLEDVMEKPHVGEPQAESVPLDTDWEYQQEKPEQAYSESVSKEDPRSLENEIKKLDAGESERAIVVAQEKEFEEKPSQLDDIRSCVEKKPAVMETKLESATIQEEEKIQEVTPDQVDGGYVCKEDETSSVEKQLENETGVDFLEPHRDRESQEEETDLLDTGAECEGHATDSVENEKEKVQVGEPEVKEFTLNKEDYLQEQPDHTHGGCVSQEHIITNSLENGSEDPDVEEPWVGGVTLHKYEQCHKDEPDQQSDRGLVVNELNSFKSELEKIEVGQPEVEGIALQNDECPQEKSDYVHYGSVCQADETTESLETAVEEYKMGKPQVGNDKDQECQEDKTTDSLENVMEEYKVGKPQVGSDKDQKCQEDKITDSLQNAMQEYKVGKPHVGGDIDQESHEEKSDQQLDLGTASEEHSTNFIESEMDKLEVQEPEGAVITLNTEVCQEEENEQDPLENVQNPDSQAADVMLDKDQVYQEENPDKVDCNSVNQERTQSSVEHDIEKLEAEELQITSAINQERDCQEDIINSVEAEMEQSKSEVESATLEKKKESPAEIPDQVDSGYACQEHEMHSMENPLKKPEVEEPEVEGVAPHKNEEIQEDDLDQLEREAICEGHAETREMEKVEAKMFEAALDKEKCEEEKYQEADVLSVCEKHPKTDLLEHARENPNLGDPQVEGVMLDKNLGLQEDLRDQIDSDYVCEEHPTSPVDNEVAKPEVEGLENSIAVKEREYQEEDTEKQVEIGMEQSKPEVESVAPAENKESLEEMPDQIHSGYECTEHEMQSVENELEKPEVGEPEVKGDAIHKVIERRDNDLDKPTVHEGYAKTGVECEKEGKEPEAALSKEDSEEHKHHNADNFLYKEPQETDLLEHAMEEPVMEEPQVEGAMLDKDQESPEDKHVRVSSESVCQEHSASSTENERGQIEAEELEKATTIKEEKKCLEEDTTQSVENEIEECAAFEEKKESPEEMPVTINSDHVHEEHEMHSTENEQVKPEGEAEVESVALHKKKDGQEDKLGQLERDTVCEGDAENFAESQIEKLEVGIPELDKKVSEEEKHHQLNDGSNHEDQQVTDILEHAKEKPDVEEPRVEGVTLEIDQKLQEEIPDQVCSDSVSQKEPTSSVENEMEQHELAESEQAITNKKVKDCHEELIIKSVDNEMEQPKLEEESASPLQEKKDSPEDMPDQTDSGCEHKEDEKQSMEKGLETLEMGEPEVKSVPLHDKEESHKDTLNQLERGAISEECTKNSVESHMEKLEAVKPKVNTTALDEEECEEGKHDQVDGGSVCEEHQASDSPDEEEPQVEGVTLNKDQESPKIKADQVDDSDFTCQEQSESSKESTKEKLEIGEPQIAIAIEDDKECQEEDTINSVDNEMEQPEPEAKSATFEEKKESSEQMPQVESVTLDKDWECQQEEPEQVLSDSACRSAENDIEKLEVGGSKVATAVGKEKEYREEKPSHLSCEDRTPEVEEPEVESAALKEEKELQEEMPYQVNSGYVCKEDETNSTGDRPEKEPEVNKVAFHEEKQNQEDKPGLLVRGTVCEGHATNSIENEMEVGEPEVKHTTLNKEVSLQEPLGQADATNPVKTETVKLQIEEPDVRDTTLNTDDGGSICEEHQVIGFPEHAMEKPDVEELQVKDATPDKDQQAPEEKFDQVDSDSAYKELPPSSLGSEIEKLEVGEREYKEESPSQCNVCEEYGIGAVLENPDIKEPEVQSAALEGNQVCQEKKSHQVENDSVCNELEKESVEVSEVKDPQLESVALYQIESNENKAEEVSSCPDEQLITESVAKDMEKLEVGETQGLTIEMKEECQPDHADHTSCAREKQAPTSVASDMEKCELREPEAGAVLDKVQYQEEEPSKVHRSSISEAHTTNLLENEVENSKLEEPEVNGLKLDEEREREQNHANAESIHHNTWSSLDCEVVEHLNLEGPEASGAALDTADCQEEEPCQLHKEPICEEQKMNSLENEMEELEVGELEGSVKLEEKDVYQEQKPADIVNVSKENEQTTGSLESEKENLEVENPEVTLEEHQDEGTRQLGSGSACEEPDVGEQEVNSAALEEKGECQEEGPGHIDSGRGYQEQATKSEEAELDTKEVTLDKMQASHEDKPDLNDDSSTCGQQPADEMEELEMGELEGSVKYDEKNVYQEQKPAGTGKISEENEQTTSSLESEKEKLEVEDPKVTFEEHRNEEPGQLGSGSACEVPNMGKQEVDSAALKEKECCQKEGPEHVNSGCGYEEQATKTGKAELDTKGITLDEMQASHEDKLDQIDNSSACGQQQMEELEVGELEGSVKLDEKDVYQEQRPADIVNVSNENEQTTRSLESEKEKLEVEDPVVTLEEHQDEEPCQLGSGSAGEEQDVGKGKREVDSAALTGKDECQEGPDHVDGGCGYEGQATKSGEAELDAVGVTLDKMQASHEDKPDQINKSSACGQQPADKMEELEVRELEGSVKLDEQDVYPEPKPADNVNVSEKNEQTTSSLESIKEKLEVEDPKVTLEEHQAEEPGKLGSGSACEESNVGRQEVDNAALQAKEKCQKEGPDHVDSGCGYEESATKSGEAELEKEPDTEGVTLDEMQASHEDKPDQIDNSSACGQQPAVAVEHEMRKLEVEEPQEEYSGKEESQKEDSEQLSTGFAKSEVDKVEAGNPEVQDVLLDSKQWQNIKPNGVQDDSVCKQYSTRSVEDMENLEVGDLEIQSVVLGRNTEREERNLDHAATGSVYEEQTSDFVEKVAHKSDVRAPEVEDIMLGGKESQSQMPHQMISKYRTDSGQHDMDKFEGRQPELGNNGTLEECQGKIPEETDNGSACEIKKPELKVILVEEEKECQGGKPDQVDGSRSVSEAQKVDFVENETEKPEAEEPEVQDDVLEEKECPSEKPDQDENSSLHEEHAPKPEVEEPEVQGNVLDEVCHSERPDPDVSNSVCEEQATDSKIDDKDELEAHQPEDQVIASDTLVREPRMLDSLKNETELLKVGESEVNENVRNQECHSEKPDQVKTSSVFEEHAAESKEDVKDELEVNQPEVENPDHVVVTSTSKSEAHTLDSLKRETEKTEEVPEWEDNVLEQHECLGEKPDQEESSLVCKEHAADSKKPDKDELEVNQPEGGKPDQVVTDSTSVSEVHTLDSLMNETEKPEERVPETEDKVLEQKECLDEKHDQHESGSVCGEYGTDSKEADLDKLEVNQPSQVITSSTSINEAHKLETLENEMEVPEDEVQQVEDNVPEKKECLGEKPDEDEKSSVCGEHVTDSIDDSNELEVNQLEEREPEQVVANSICLSEAHALASLENETEKLMENETEKAEERVPDVEDNVLEQEECHGEKPDQDESSSVCEEHATNSKKDIMGNVEVNQPEVTEHDQVVPGNTSLSEHTLHSPENEIEKPEVGLPEVEDDGFASRTFSATQEGTLSSAEDCLKTKEEQGAQTVYFPVALRQENRAIELGLPSMARDTEQASIHDFSTGETGQDQDQTDVPAEGEIEEIGFRQPISMHHAPKHQEGPQEIPGQLDMAKPEEAKQEPMHHLKSKEEDQEVHLTDVPATLAPAELQAQEATPVDEEGLELSTTHTIPSDVKEMCMDIKQHEDGAEEQHSPQSVLQKQESPAEDDIKYGIHAVAATNAELLGEKDVQLEITEQNNADERQSKQEETSATLEGQKGDFQLEEPAPICIPLHHSDVMIIATKTEPAKVELDEAFLSLATPGMGCSSPSNLLPLPL